MKKAIVIFILLILAAGTAGYFGHIRIEPGTYGVAHSTITGTLPFPLETGRVYWLWQKLVPKTFKLTILKKEPYSVKVETAHPLPGSEQLSEYGDFRIGLSVVISFEIPFDTAKTLLENGVLDGFEDTLRDAVSSDMSRRVSSFLVDNLIEYTRGGRVGYDALGSLQTALDRGIRDITVRYGLEAAAWNLVFTEIPQLEIYSEALNKYITYMETVQRYREEELAQEHDFQAQVHKNDAEIDRLGKYGELITKYPDLLKFFYIEKFSDQADVLILPEDEKTGYPKMLEERDERDARPQEKPPRSEPPVLPDNTQGSTEEEVSADETVDSEPVTGEKEWEEEAIPQKKWYEHLKFWHHEKNG